MPKFLDDFLGINDPHPILFAVNKAELYRKDFEYEDFYKWLDKRQDPMRPDMVRLMNEIPLYFTPAQVPPPIRDHFLGALGRWRVKR